MNERVYVMGPMSGFPNLNSGAFSAAFDFLTKNGFHVVSPHHIERPFLAEDRDKKLPPGEVYRQVMPMDIFALASSDMVIALPFWEKSPGCGLERHAADLFNIPVYALDSDDYVEELGIVGWLQEALTLYLNCEPIHTSFGGDARLPGELA